MTHAELLLKLAPPLLSFVQNQNHHNSPNLDVVFIT
jgi:hypothetical protein